MLPGLSKSTVLCALLAVAASMLPGRDAMAETQAAARTLVSLEAGLDASSCDVIAPPARRLETVSKYDQAIASKSVIDAKAATARAATLRPIEEAVRRLQALSAAADRAAADQCIALNARHWAEAGSLTDMASADANLTRDRFVAAISEVLVSVQSRGADVASDRSVRLWLSSLAEQTMRFYDWNAGPNSQRNNHRYWAGLSVGRIGYLTGDVQMTAWARNSLEIGLCQIDEEGFLPLELQRGPKAFDYHLYAYVALRSLSDLLQSTPASAVTGCQDRLADLDRRIRGGIGAMGAFELRTGMRQDDPPRKNLMAAARLAATQPSITSPGVGINY